jgi:hypothetical protein
MSECSMNFLQTETNLTKLKEFAQYNLFELSSEILLTWHKEMFLIRRLVERYARW